MSKAVRKQEQEEAMQNLREWLKPGDTVYLILRHVSRSGMQRSISPIVFLGGDTNNPRYLYWNVSKALGWREDREREAVKVDGCGMDMGFHLVYELAAELFGQGYDLKHRWL